MSAGTVRPHNNRKRRDTIREFSRPATGQSRAVRTYRPQTVRQPFDNGPEISDDEEMAFVAGSTIAIAVLGMVPLIVFLLIYYLSPQ